MNTARGAPARAVTVIAALALSLAGCSTVSSTPTPQPTSQPTAAPGPTPTAAPTATAAEWIAQNSTPLITSEYVTPSGFPIDTAHFKKDPPYTIAFINWSAANSWTVQVTNETKDEASRFSQIGEFIALSSDGDSNKQISQMQDMISRQVDAIIVDPISPEGLVPSIEQAAAAGIPVFTFASSAPTDALISSVLADEIAFGRLQGNWLMETLNCTGKIIVLNGLTGNSTNDARRQGFGDAIKACPDGGAGITILAEADAMWAYDQGKTETQRLLTAYPEIDGVQSQGGAMTQGAIDAFQAANRPLVPMTGEDNNGFLKKWQELEPSGFKAMAASEPTWQARLDVQLALMTLQGMTVYPSYKLNVPTIYSEQLTQYVRPEYNDNYWCNSMMPKAVADGIYMNP